MGTQRWLQNISRIYLSQGKGKAIEVVKSRNLVRIMAPMVVAESCLDAIGKTLEKIRTKTFNLDKISIQGLDAKVAEQLGKITNSVIEINHLRKEVRSHTSVEAILNIVLLTEFFFLDYGYLD